MFAVEINVALRPGASVIGIRASMRRSDSVASCVDQFARLTEQEGFMAAVAYNSTEIAPKVKSAVRKAFPENTIIVQEGYLGRIHR